MEEYKKDETFDDNIEISNQEYKRRINDIFERMDDNRKLRFWYKYISTIEEG